MIYFTKERMPTIGIGDKYPWLGRFLGDPLYIKIIYFFCCMVQTITFVHNILGPYIKLSLVYGALVFLYDFFTNKNILRNKCALVLFIFWACLALSVIVNYDKGIGQNISHIAYTFLELFVIASIPFHKNTAQAVKEIKTINLIAIWTITGICLFSFVTFVLNLQEPYVINDSMFYFGFSLDRRLYGITGNPNAMGILSILGVCLILFHLTAFSTKHRWIYIIDLLICLSTGLLSNSRSAMVAFYGFIFVFVFLSYLLKYSKPQAGLKKRILSSGLVGIVLLFFAMGFNDRMLPALGYIPGTVQYYQQLKTSEEENPDIEESETKFTAIVTTRTDTVTMTLGSGRLDLWKAGLQIFKNHPLWGVGRAQTSYYGALYTSNDNLPGFDQGSMHNIFLQTLASYGALSLAALLLVMIYYMLAAWRKLATLFKQNQYSPWFIGSLCMIVLLLIHGMFEFQILYRVSLCSFMFAYFLGILNTCLQTNLLLEEPRKKTADFIG